MEYEIGIVNRMLRGSIEIGSESSECFDIIFQKNNVMVAMEISPDKECCKYPCEITDGYYRYKSYSLTGIIQKSNYEGLLKNWGNLITNYGRGVKFDGRKISLPQEVEYIITGHIIRGEYFGSEFRFVRGIGMM